MTIGDKKVPMVPAAVGVVLLIVCLVLVVRACSGESDSQPRQGDSDTAEFTASGRLPLRGATVWKIVIEYAWEEYNSSGFIEPILGEADKVILSEGMGPVASSDDGGEYTSLGTSRL